jgi:hypothetical protein
MPITLPMFTPEDRARIIDPDAPLLAPNGQNPLPLLERIAGLSNSSNPDAPQRLRAIGEWLYGIGGIETLAAARTAVVDLADDALGLGEDIDRAWHGIGRN